MDEELAADPRLCAVADLFAQPPPFRTGSLSDSRPRNRTASTPAIRPASCIVLSVIVTMLGLVCCALTAALRIPVVASAGAVLAVAAAMAFAVVVIHRRTRTSADTGTDRAPSTLTAGSDEFPA
ncbi:MAG TPA: hypothetical protein VJX10_12210 [Pseudonocardiaceae bacterium]|nr:hypothetical protein [Pseudonocardiaceae bacterium]